jgi:hypothetical protein
MSYHKLVSTKTYQTAGRNFTRIGDLAPAMQLNGDFAPIFSTL